MKRMCLSLFCFLLFFSFMTAAERPLSQTDEAKLSGLLKDLVYLYRNAKHVTSADLFNRQMSAVKKGFGSPVPFKVDVKSLPLEKAVKRSSAIVVDPQKPMAYPILESVGLLAEVQERWGNPEYDVLACKVVFGGSVEELAEGLTCKLGAVADSEIGKIMYMELPGNQLELLTKKPMVKRIVPESRKSLNNDQGTFWTGASLIRKQEGNRFTKGYTGEGVIVGVIDSGIDWTHEDFVDPLTGETRILYLWDSEVDTPGKSPAEVFGGALSGLTDGTVWTKAEIDAGSCTATDTNGHGTHVTGSAAGNGSATGKYAGMAPNADIIFVKGLNVAGNDGALFIYELASRLGRPCAVNMSYGPSLPFHYISYQPYNWPVDNTDVDALQFQAWNAQYGPGHIPVKSAGNNGHWNTFTGSSARMNGAYHIEGHLSAGQSQSHTYTVSGDYLSYMEEAYNNWWMTNYGYILYPFPGFNASTYPWNQFGLWSDEPIYITVESPDGTTLGPIPYYASGAATLPGQGTVYFMGGGQSAENGDYYTRFALWPHDDSSQMAAGEWKLHFQGISGAVNYDVWCSQICAFQYIGAMYTTPIPSYFTGNYSHSKYIIHEGASDYLITVGNFCTRDNWTDVDGNNWSYVKKPIVGQINDSSSPGPARDGRMKPDIAAPGSIIISAWSKDCSYGDLYKPDASHMTMSGTSMSAPHVTGGVALMLQKNRNYTVPGLRSTIGRWAHHDWFTDTGSPDAWGYGKFNLRPLNSAPVAVITVDRTEIVLDDMEYTVNFDGSGSSDPEGLDLTYTFACEAMPLDDGAAPSAHSFSSSGSAALLEVDPDVEGRYRASLKVNDGLADSETVWSGYVETRFYPILPPVNLTVTRTENDLILFKLYQNTVRWEANPENKSKVDKYVLYKKAKGADDGSYAWVKDYQPTEELIYDDDKRLTQDELFTYKVVAVNKRGVVSDPVVAGN